MELRHRTTGTVITESQFRAEHPNTSFPLVLTPEVVTGFGYDPVLEGPQPELEAPYQIAIRDGVQQINGQWFTKYIAGPVFSDADEEAAYRQRLDDGQAEQVRQTRTAKLAATDYTQLVDAPVDRQAWHIYRQALRQVPEQDGFPWNVIWPEEPAAGAGPDYNTFYNGLLISPAYQAIRVQATQSLPLTVACTEFVAAIADAKVGIPNPPALQACINNILTGAVLDSQQQAELQQLLEVSGLAELYTLPFELV